MLGPFDRYTLIEIGIAAVVVGVFVLVTWAAKPIISRRNVASEPFSRSVRRAILSSVIVVILRSELRVATQPYSGSPRWPPTGPPAPDSWRSLRRAGQRPPTPSPGTRPEI